MKKYITFFALSIFALSSLGQSYDVTVETYVGGKLEDKFSFVIKEGVVQEKGYDGKYLAKRFLAKGFENMSLVMADEAFLAKEQKEKEASKTFLQKAEEMLFALTNDSLNAEKRVTSANSVLEQNKTKIKALEEVVELGKSGSQSAKAKFEAYMAEFGPTKQDLIDAKKAKRLKKIKYQDFEEYDIGSFCRMKILKAGNRSVRFNISYAYSRLLTTAYHDGKNTDNAITKYPIFEIFERLNVKAKIVLGKPYCIQFARPSSVQEAKTIQDAIAQTRLFSGADASIPSSEDSDEESQPVQSDVKKSPLDVKGSYEKIKEHFRAETSSTLRAVFTVTAKQ